jgi:putative SOS response-associated peptidase YedK
MCVNYRPPDRDVLDQGMGLKFDVDATWKPEIWKDYVAPIVRRGANGREGILASYGMVPAHRLPPGVRFDSMNARSESVGEKRTFKSAWAKAHHCLAPMTAFYEPCYESGKAVRWGIGMADESMFAVAGLWKEWDSDAGPEYSFTQLTINADDHPLMKRFHKPGDEKRALVIVPRDAWDDWLECDDPEFARAFLQHFPAELMTSWAFPVPPRAKKTNQPSGQLFES